MVTYVSEYKPIFIILLIITIVTASIHLKRYAYSAENISKEQEKSLMETGLLEDFKVNYKITPPITRSSSEEVIKAALNFGYIDASEKDRESKATKEYYSIIMGKVLSKLNISYDIPNSKLNFRNIYKDMGYITKEFDSRENQVSYEEFVNFWSVYNNKLSYEKENFIKTLNKLDSLNMLPQDTYRRFNLDREPTKYDIIAISVMITDMVTAERFIQKEKPECKTCIYEDIDMLY